MLLERKGIHCFKIIYWKQKWFWIVQLNTLAVTASMCVRKYQINFAFRIITFSSHVLPALYRTIAFLLLIEIIVKTHYFPVQGWLNLPNHVTICGNFPLYRRKSRQTVFLATAHSYGRFSNRIWHRAPGRIWLNIEFFRSTNAQ